MAGASDDLDEQIVLDLDIILGDVEMANAVSPKAANDSSSNMVNAVSPDPAQREASGRKAPSKTDPAPLYLDDDGIVAPDGQVKNIAVIYAVDQRSTCISMLAFLDQVALEVSRRPFHLRKIFMAAFSKGAEIEGLLRAAKLAEASAAIVLLPAAAKKLVKPMERAFSKAELLFHCICADEVLDRKRASDLVLDLMLQRR